jgi:uncharacterized protein (UPF0218 family)
MRELKPPFHCTEKLRETFKEIVGELIKNIDIPELAVRLTNRNKNSVEGRSMGKIKVTDSVEDLAMGGEVGTDPVEGLSIYHMEEIPLPIVCIGDTTTINMFHAGVIPDLAIIDFGTRRGDLGDGDMKRMHEILAMETVRVVEVENPAEWITKELWESIREFFTHYYNKFKIGRPERKGTTPLFIRVNGEEDLASLPCVHFAEQGGHILYGLPDKGLIHIQVDTTHRTIVRDALLEMEA